MYNTNSTIQQIQHNYWSSKTQILKHNK